MSPRKNDPLDTRSPVDKGKAESEDKGAPKAPSAGVDADAPVTRRLHISGLNENLSVDDLRGRFGSFGEVLALDGWPAQKDANGMYTTMLCSELGNMGADHWLPTL